MISLDTNLLVRIFVDDPNQTAQSAKARKTVKEYKTAYITQIVQVETVWVLDRAYGFTRVDIVKVLESLANNQAFRLENEINFVAAMQLYGSSNIEFSDALILERSRQEKVELLTFDKKLQKLPGVKGL